MQRRAVVVVLLLGAALLPQSAPALEPRCARSEVRALVNSFIRAYNRGHVDYLDKIWAQEPDFFWYFVQDDVTRRSPLSEDRASLPLYFAERAAYAEQLGLRRLSISWERGWHDAWDITFELARHSDHPDASGRYHGKGAATCQRLHAWAMGRDV